MPTRFAPIGVDPFLLLPGAQVSQASRQAGLVMGCGGTRLRRLAPAAMAPFMYPDALLLADVHTGISWGCSL
eukprot:349951-Chlamydomonas_euryale.AAC.5